MNSGFQILDCGFFVTGTWIPDSIVNWVKEGGGGGGGLIRACASSKAVNFFLIQTCAKVDSAGSDPSFPLRFSIKVGPKFVQVYSFQ